jgi:hypothetical protein
VRPPPLTGRDVELARVNTGKHITAEDAHAAKLLVEADLDESFFEGRIGRLTGAEKTYV